MRRRLSRAVRLVLAALMSTLVSLLVFGVSMAEAGRYFHRPPVTVENPSAKVVLIAFALMLGIDLALIVFLAFLPCKRRARSVQIEIEPPRAEHEPKATRKAA
jgi:hypothetical protein